MYDWMMSKNAWSPGRISRSVKLCGCGLQRSPEIALIASTQSEPMPYRRAVASATISLSFTPGFSAFGDVLVDAVDHRRRHVEQRQLVDVLHFARREHRLLAVAHLDAELLQLEHHRRLDDVDAERHVAHALGVEQRLDLARRVAKQHAVAADRAAQAQQPRAAVIVLQPRRVQPVVLRRRAEIPDVRIAVAGQQANSGVSLSRAHSPMTVLVV